LGECTWGDADIDEASARDRLLARARNAPWAAGRELVPVLWLECSRHPPGVHVVTPDEVLEALR
jgi:hypothetical protein